MAEVALLFFAYLEACISWDTQLLQEQATSRIKKLTFFLPSSEVNDVSSTVMNLPLLLDKVT